MATLVHAAPVHAHHVRAQRSVFVVVTLRYAYLEACMRFAWLGLCATGRGIAWAFAAYVKANEPICFPDRGFCVTNFGYGYVSLPLDPVTGEPVEVTEPVEV